ncbi:MAG: aminoacyl-tRNA hydrolase [Eubacterium sp.]|nr:aminoacyl-tRNA hydrolase [Eubacterium sp.]
MYLIAGLGNPTRQYEKTRHNIGFDTIDKIAEEYHISVMDVKYRSLCGSGMLAGQKVLLLKPQTYMNNSGEAIRAAMDFYKLDPAEQLLVIYDDISLEPGNIRIRLKGSAGGHNGMKSIIEHIGTEEFARIKVGVGAKPEGWDLADHVLSRFFKQEREHVEEAVKDAVSAAALIVGGDAAKAMNDYNKKKK